MIAGMLPSFDIVVCCKDLICFVLLVLMSPEKGGVLLRAGISPK